MGLLAEITKDVESYLSENHKDVIELKDLSEKNANSLVNLFNKYDVKKAKIISSEDGLVSYTLHIRNK